MANMAHSERRDLEDSQIFCTPNEAYHKSPRPSKQNMAYALGYWLGANHNAPCRVRTTMRRAGLEILVVKYDSQVRCQLEDNEGRMMGTLWQSIWLHREKCSDSILHVEGFEGCNAGKEGKLMTYAMKRVTAGAL